MAMTSDDAERAKDGAAEFLTKPVDFDLLKAQLRRLPSAADQKRRRCG